MSDPSCAPCEARGKKCDRTKGPNGCRRCVQAGLECRYLVTKKTKSTRGVKGSQSQAKQSSVNTLHGSATPPDLGVDISTERIPDPNPNDASRSGEHRSTGPQERLDSTGAIFTSEPRTDQHPQSGTRYEQLPTPVEHVNPTIKQTPVVSVKDIDSRNAQMPTPIDHNTPLPPIDGQIIQGQTSLFDSVFDPSDEFPVPSWALKNPGPSPPTLELKDGQNSGSQPSPTIEDTLYSDEDDDDPEDLENLQLELLNGLVLDRAVESNMVSFMVHSFTSWMSRFLFEPTRVIPLFREAIVRSHSYGPEAHQKMVLIANAVLNVSESTDYDLTSFTILYSESVKGVVEARARGNSSRELAIAAMQSCHEIISIMCKVCSLASVLNLMDLYAPVFRRACPESDTELVNLPRILTSIDVHLKLYATMDVLLSAITCRPMFFRYDLKFHSVWVEQALNSDDGPGLRWLAGVPDGLIVTLARMNTLLEDDGNRVEPKKIKSLENEINACTTAFSSGSGTDPALALGRIVVQESWRLVAFIYLYMGLCGADSFDPRVVSAQKKFMRLLGGVKPRRNPDTFLVVPMMILGISTSSSADQAVILTRLWGISECKKQETLGNDMIRMLTDLWARTKHRPTTWSDVRTTCSRVIGVSMENIG